jgi:hypothetical protein
MDDPNDPYSPGNLSWNWTRGGPWARPFSGRLGRRLRLPPPPGPRPRRPSKFEREQEKRADARADRLHLVALSNAGVIIMGVALGAMVVVVLVIALVSHH